MYEEMGRAINIDVADSTAAIGMCSRTGVGKTRHIQVRWLWIQDATRDKIVRLKKVRGTERSRHGNQRPRRTDTSVLIGETAAQANPVQTAPGLDRDSKRRERRRSADEWTRGYDLDVFSTNTDCETCSIRHVIGNGYTASEEQENSSENDR